jgi:hypothetical protein
MSPINTNNFNPFSLNPIFARVFPTFKTGDEWIDLKDNSGKTDGIKQRQEILRNHNDTGMEETQIDDEEIVEFLSNNLDKIPEDKIQNLIAEFINYLQDNPQGGIQYDAEFYGAVSDALAVIISGKPQYYLEPVNELLSSRNFLVRWAGVDVLFSAVIKDTSIKARIKSKIEELLAQENNKQTFSETQFDKVLYRPVEECYAKYLCDIAELIKYLDKQ